MDWRGFELHPETPAGGSTVERYFGAPRAQAMRARMQRFADEFGVEMGWPARIPNTRRALAVTEYARDHGALARFRDATMDAHWFQDRDIEADDTLSALASQVGLDPDEALSAAADPAYLGRLDEARRDAHDHMVTGIPTFFFGNTPVVGCQPYDMLALVADRQGVPRRG